MLAWLLLSIGIGIGVLINISPVFQFLIEFFRNNPAAANVVSPLIGFMGVCFTIYFGFHTLDRTHKFQARREEDARKAAEETEKKTLAAALQGEIAALIITAGTARLYYSALETLFENSLKDAEQRDKPVRFEGPRHNAPVYRASIGPRLGLLGTSICADVATVMSNALNEPKVPTDYLPRTGKLRCEAIVAHVEAWIVELTHVEKRLASISEGTDDPGPLPKTTLGNAA